MNRYRLAGLGATRGSRFWCIERKWVLLGLFSLALFFSLSPVWAQNYVVHVEGGMIDWSNWIVEAKGRGHPPKDPLNMAQARAMAHQAAVEAANKNLLEIVKGISIDSKTSVADLLLGDEGVRAGIQDLMRLSRVVWVSYLSDASVLATVSIRLTDSFADTVLPRSIRRIHTVTQPVHAVPDKERPFTGLIVDCRGFKVTPALAPAVLDEEGNEIYGARYASREYAIQYGMGGYVRDLATAQANPRVADNPLVIKAIRTAPSASIDIMISKADGERIRRMATNLGFLLKCRVVLVLE